LLRMYPEYWFFAQTFYQLEDRTDEIAFLKIRQEGEKNKLGFIPGSCRKPFRERQRNVLKIIFIVVVCRVSDPDPYPDPDPHGSALI
jgi:hypothetical protein